MIKNKLVHCTIFSLFLILSGCKAKEPDKKDSAQATPPPALTVSTQKVAEKKLAKKLMITGSISAWDLLSVSPTANGLKVVEIKVDAGDLVKSGQLLAKLDDSMISAQLESARSRLLSLEQQLEKALNPNRKQDLLRQKASLEQAEANFVNARNNAERFKNLFANGAISKAELDNRLTTLETTEAFLKQEQQRMDLLNAGTREEDIRIAQASVMEIKAQIKQLEVQLAQTKILAPDDGLIFDRGVHLGDVSASMSKFFTIVRQNRYELQAKVPETDLSSLKKGAMVNVSSDAQPEKKIIGRIRQIGPGVDPLSRQSVIKIDLENTTGLQTGQFVKGFIDLGDLNGIAVPNQAIINNEGRDYVFTVEKELALLKPVVTGIMSDGLVEIKSGLKAGDSVIDQGAGFIRDGDRVRVVEKTGGTK